MIDGPMPYTAFPLQWPAGWKRTNSRKYSNFVATLSFARARDELLHELKLMGVRDWNVIISTNIPLRRDGLPYSGQAQPADPGVAVYFRYKERPMVFACDTYRTVEDNCWAIRKTIEALRGIQRWGASDMMERSFTGFEALPPPKVKKQWWEVLKVNRNCTSDEAKQAYRGLAKLYHPDYGSGEDDQMQEVNRAWDEAQKERSW